MSTQPTLGEMKKFQYIPFKADRESWARYKIIEDEAIIKIKHILVNVKMYPSLDEALKKKQENQKKVPIDLFLQMQNVMGVEVPSNLRGPPSKKNYSSNELAESVVREDLEFERINPTTWVSIYELKNKIKVKVQSNLLDVSRTNKYDNTGDSLYLVSSTANIKIIMPKKYRRTQKIKSSIKQT